MLHVQRGPRRGFTLVELLVVITILGMLMSLTSVAVWNAMKTARRAKLTVELDHISQSMQAYKEAQIAFPPCMGLVSITDRKVAFMRHINLAYANANYAVSVAGFNNITKTIGGTGTGQWGYNFKDSSGAVRPLDLNTLDQAESLVFWLGGFPTPVTTSGSPVATRRLFGFHRDTDAPLKRDLFGLESTGDPTRYRTDPMFGFDQTRLVDNDDDGWLEYSPLAPKPGVSTAPYVYFDSDTYNATSTTLTVRHYCYPRLTDTTTPSQKAAELFARWGIAAPMANKFDPSGTDPITWERPTGFQIICAGLDGQFSSPNADLAESARITVFPAGFVFEAGTNYSTTGSYTRPEYDNLTSLSNKSLEGARNEAQQ